MTMRELAKLAGVSVSTVSKVFSDAPDVGEETKNRIIGLAKEAGCFSKYNKEKYPKKTIAIICPEYESSYYMSYVVKLQSIIEKHGGIAVVISYHFNFRLQRDLVNYCASYLKVDGIITFCLKEPLKNSFELPIVNLFSTCDRNIDEITEDHDDVIGEAVKALYERGHRNVAFVGEELSEPREQSFIAAMKKYTDCTPFIYDSPFRFERAGEDGAEKVTEKFPECTALICAYDNIAFGAMKSLKAKGFKIPEDISVIGVDNLNPIRDATPPLSSIACDTEEICQIAWELLEKRMKNPRSGSRQHIVMKCRIFLRDSVGEARKTK